MDAATILRLGRVFLMALALALLAGCGGSSGGGDADDRQPTQDEQSEHKDGGKDKDKGKDKDQPKEPARPSLSGGGHALEQDHYHTSVASFDGTEIAITVFQPKLAEQQPAPLILFSHGWGGSRSKTLGEDGMGTGPDMEAARRAWESGYFVITFDQRGFGESGGKANVQDPEIEGRDVQAILQWAEDNLQPHLAYYRGSPRVGGLGLSYGGGFQLIGAALDPRFDALVPMITWADLSYSLSPNGVPKTDWLTLLTAAGGASGSTAGWVNTSYLETTARNEPSEDTRSKLYSHSFGSFCAGEREDGYGTPQVDAFFIQGLDDTLFNANEAVWNFDCLRRAGNDAYLLAKPGGHLLPAFQGGNLAAFDDKVACGGKRYRTADLIYRFLDGKLREFKDKIDMPRVCIVQDDAHGLTAAKVPVGGTPFGVDSGKFLVGPPVDLVFDLLRSLELEPLVAILQAAGTSAVDLLTGILLGVVDPDRFAAVVPKILEVLPPELVNELTAAPHFVPLYTATGLEDLAGLPLADLQVDGSAELDPRIFVGVGVKRFDDRRAQLLHEQVVPMRGVGKQRHELAGVGTRLRAGDQVGLMLYGFHPQFTASFSRLPSAVTVRGRVELPLSVPGKGH